MESRVERLATEAATIPCASVSAWHALFESGKLQPGETVLLLGTGGVSMLALQLATAVGADVIFTSSSDEKLEIAKSPGVYQTINHATHPERLTSGRDVDHVVEVGSRQMQERTLTALEKNNLRAIIDQNSTFPNALEAYCCFQTHKHVGKVVIEF